MTKHPKYLIHGVVAIVAILGIAGTASITGTAVSDTADSFSNGWLLNAESDANAGVFVRFKLLEPVHTPYYVQLGGIAHVPNWYMPGATIPAGAGPNNTIRAQSGDEFTQWFDLKAHAGNLLHKRQSRAGGVAEFLNVIARFITDSNDTRRTVVIQLADQPNDAFVVKEFQETFEGNKTSFLASPELRKDANSLETASQMTTRRVQWALDASKGERRSPEHHIIQTSVWSPQRPELDILEGHVLNQLGFNTVGNLPQMVRDAFPHIKTPEAIHEPDFRYDPYETQQSIDTRMQKLAAKQNLEPADNVPYNFSDEVIAREKIGENPVARAHFYQWLYEKGVTAAELGVDKLSDVVPLEAYYCNYRTVDEINKNIACYDEAAKVDPVAAARVFYYTSRFRQEAGTQRLRWNTESFHKYFPTGWQTSTLVADHPYFSGTGLGMGRYPNLAWGGYRLALDWFDLVRKKAVDLFAIEDWMGLQYMYGPSYTWEGFQLMGFQASMFRSAGQHQDQDVPIMAWITPSDETNLLLKVHSALAQGTKHFFFWSYGPTATSTENYWSDLQSEYTGIARVTRQLASAEDILFPAKHRTTKVALLYSISTDLWQVNNYQSMLDRRGIYLSLVHDQYQVDMLTEEDIEAGRLDEYKVLYTTDPNITTGAVEKIANWVSQGGYLFASGNAGTRNQFNEPVVGLANVLGIQAGATAEQQPVPVGSAYRIRGGLNGIPYLDSITLSDESKPILGPGFSVIGLKTTMQPNGGTVVGRFNDQSPAVISNTYGNGKTLTIASTPGISYIKDAQFVPAELKEKWPAAHRQFINAMAKEAGVLPQVTLSHPVVEAGVYDGANGAALVLANFTYEDIPTLNVKLPVRTAVSQIYTADNPGNPIPFTNRKPSALQHAEGFSGEVEFSIPLGLDQIVLISYNQLEPITSIVDDNDEAFTVDDALIIDDKDDGFAISGNWKQSPVLLGHNAGLHNHVKGNGSDKATWTFTDLTPGTYQIATTWFPHSNRATNAPYTIRDGKGGAILAQVRMNQEQAPNDFNDQGSNWENLSIVTITGNELVIELSDDADEYVIADAVRVTQDNGEWQRSPYPIGHSGSLHNHVKGNGSDKATWTFTNVLPGTYTVSATWFAHSNRATNAPFTIRDGKGGAILAQVRMNQEQAPNDFNDQGSNWENLSTVTITGNELVIELSDDADEYVIADAVRIEQVLP